MTSQIQRAAAATPVARPPVRQSTLVRSDRRHTFEVFVRTIGIWWPVNPFSAGRERTRDVTFEQRLGGRVYETWGDGTQVDWGSLLAWQPPERFVMTWNMTSVATEVELTFAELGPALTRVAVEHRGWERLTDDQLAEDCALPGGYASGAFTKGWAQILGCLSAAAEGTAAEGTAADRTAADRTAADRTGAEGTAAEETAAGSTPGNGREREAGNSSGNAGGLA